MTNWARYWRDRWERHGNSYVAAGNRQDSFDEQHDYLCPIVRKVTREHAGKNGVTIDFGCGAHRFRRCVSGSRYIGLDLIPDLCTVKWDGRTIPGTAEVILAIFVLQHIVDFHEYEHWIQEFYWSLKPNGALFVVDHDQMEKPDHHMRPRGHAPISSFDWREWRLLEPYAGHWVGIFVR